MEHLTVMGIIFFLSSTQAVQMCTTLDSLKRVEKNKFLPESQILNLTMPGIMACSRACLMGRRCKSFNFNMETGECQLNSEGTSRSTELQSHNEFVFSDISHWPESLAGVCANHTCPLNSYCDSVESSNFVCHITGCVDVPSVINGHLTETQIGEESTIGTVLAYTPGFMSQGELVCRDNGTWSSPVCASSSCNMVKQYLPDSEDGEYWLRLTNFDNYTTKMYCHNMSTSSPQEFLTLPNINYGIFPMVTNKNCDRETEQNACGLRTGEVWFSKIRVDISTMEVILEDRTFVNVTGNGYYLRYAQPRDCYTPHPNNELRCGTKGRFDIDLRGTGWRVSENQQWEVYGWEATIETIERQMNGTVINLRCGGYAGGCTPTGGLFLTPLQIDKTLI